MKRILSYCLFILLAHSSSGQYYLRGEIKDQKGNLLPNVKLFLHSSRMQYQTGAWGSFGITSNSLWDSLTISLDGYETQKLAVKTNIWQTLVLKPATIDNNKSKPRLISISGSYKAEGRFNPAFDNETYFQIVENDFVPAEKYPNTGFSLNVNKASYSNVRRFINMKSEVPPDAVRVEEMINYFNLHYQEPKNKDIFSIDSKISSNPWNPQEKLLFLNVSAKKLDLSKIPPANFVFLIDVSGSMDMPNRLPLLKAAFQMFIKNLRPIDQVSIVVYGGSVGIWLPPTPGNLKDSIARSIEAMTASGDTPGESAIRSAYALASKTFIPGGINRVILATDGDFNVGETSEKALEELITRQKQTGVYLTCLGVGMGNFKDSKLQALAKKGNGNYAYLDDIMEAEKVLVKELTQTFYAVADDVAMNVEFDPSLVKQYRLIGFDNRRDAVSDPSSFLEGGEIGSGSSTLAIFEIVPAPAATSQAGKNLATIKLRYSLCNDSSTNHILYKVPAQFEPFDSIHTDFRLATAITMFGLKLRKSKYISNTGWEQIRMIAQKAANKNDFLQREFLEQIDKAEELYDPKKKKKVKKKKEE